MHEFQSKERLSDEELETLSRFTNYAMRRGILRLLAVHTIQAVDADDRRQRVSAIMAGATGACAVMAWAMVTEGTTIEELAGAYGQGFAEVLRSMAESGAVLDDLEEQDFQEFGGDSDHG